MAEKTFEEMMENLEKISVDLEKGDLTLDQSVKKFEEGMEISKKCSDILNDAEKKIKILIQDGDNIVEENFEGDNNE